MSAQPANQKLWDALISQAHAKFAKWPSIAASAWVHKEYVKHGGQFVDAKRAKTGRRT